MKKDPAYRTMRPIYFGWFVFMGIGYLIFLGAWLSGPTGWVAQFVTGFSPIVSAINSAARVGAAIDLNPVPAQAVILYCAFGHSFLLAWSLAWGFGNRSLRTAWFAFAAKQVIELGYSRLKLFFIGIFGLGTWLMSPLYLFVHDRASVSWQAKALFSSSVVSVSMLILVAVMTSIGVTVGFLYLYFSLSKFLTHFTNKAEGSHG